MGSSVALSLSTYVRLLVLSCLAMLGGCASVAGREGVPEVHVSEERDAGGRVLRTVSYYCFKERGEEEMVLHGPRTDWYSNGAKRCEVYFSHGVRDGATTEWDAEGRVTRRQSYVAGGMAGATPIEKLFGAELPAVHSRFRAWVGGEPCYEQLYDERGELVGIVIRSDGVDIARCVRSDRDERGRYHRSHWAYWSASGELLGSGEFRDGVPWEGVCFTHRQNGSLASTEFGRYREGKLIERVPAQVAATLGERAIPVGER
jgi:hypothetical protein